MNEIMPPEIDRAQAFILYATFAGDVEKTAHALGIRPADVLRVVDEEKWTEQLRTVIELKKTAKPGDWDRAINRALNFAQAHRMRLLVERVLHKIIGMDDEALKDHLYSEVNTKTGGTYRKLSLRPLADLATALEKAQSMSYLALTDTVQDRTRRKEQGESETAGSELHERIAAAVAAVGKSTSPRAQLLDAQLQMADHARKEQVTAKGFTSEPKVHPNDSDDH